MKKSILLFALLLGGLLFGEGKELFKNPELRNHGEGWANWGKGRLAIHAADSGVILKAETSGLNQGLAQSIKLKALTKYRFSCTLSAKLPAGSKITVLSVYVANFKWGRNYRNLAGNQEEDTHILEFSTPEDLPDQGVLFRPVILIGPGEIALKNVSLQETGIAESEKKEVRLELPKPRMAAHPMLETDLSKEPPANIRAHISEKPSPLPAGASVEQKDNSYLINYAFTTAGHDAVMFDIVKDLPSCAKASFEIESDGRGHRLFFVMTDANGESFFSIKPLKLDFRKQQVIYPLEIPKAEPYSRFDAIWGGDDNQYMDLPIKCLTIGIDDSPDSTTGSGTVIIRNLKVGNW